MAIAMTAVVFLVAVVAFAGGVAVGGAFDTKNRLRELGFTKQSARLHAEAARILNSLIAITDLDGDFAADILSPATRERVQKRLADYRKQVNT